MFTILRIQDEPEAVLGMPVDLAPDSGLKQRVRVRLQLDLIALSRHDADRRDDITVGIEPIRSHVEWGPLSDSLVSDAVRMLAR